MSDGKWLFYFSTLWIAGVNFLAAGGAAITYCKYGWGFMTTCNDMTLAANSASGFAAVAATFAFWGFIHMAEDD
jgi:hypothetical protein